MGKRGERSHEYVQSPIEPFLTATLCTVCLPYAGCCVLVLLSMMKQKLTRDVQLKGLGSIVSLCRSDAGNIPALCDAGQCAVFLE